MTDKTLEGVYWGAVALTCIFFALRISGAITWSIYWVVSPLIAVGVVWIIGAFVALVISARDSKDD